MSTHGVVNNNEDLNGIQRYDQPWVAQDIQNAQLDGVVKCALVVLSSCMFTAGAYLEGWPLPEVLCGLVPTILFIRFG